MALKDFEKDMMRDTRCGYCKVIPHVMMTDTRFINVCPSIAKFNFHGFSAGGRMVAALSLLRDRIEYTDGFLDMIYKCQMDGACDVSCKIDRDLEPLQVMQELRIKCVEDGQLIAGHMPVLEGLRKEDNMLQRKKADRGKWAEGLGVKELTKSKGEVLFHAGCRYSFDEELWPVVKGCMKILKEAGVDAGIMGKDEACCGGRAYEMGYEAELVKYADHNIQAWKTAGVKTVVTNCSCCYQTFKVLYDKIGKKPDVEIYHFTEYLDKLIKEGKLKLKKKVPMKVTYHDPCHLSNRFAKITAQPRKLLKSIPGMTYKEMPEADWCCGAAGSYTFLHHPEAMGVLDRKMGNVEKTGADTLATECPACMMHLSYGARKKGLPIQVRHVSQILDQAYAAGKAD